jgi:hypothetical protein
LMAFTSLPPKPKVAETGRFIQLGAFCSGGGSPAQLPPQPLIALSHGTHMTQVRFFPACLHCPAWGLHETSPSCCCDLQNHDSHMHEHQLSISSRNPHFMSPSPPFKPLLAFSSLSFCSSALLLCPSHRSSVYFYPPHSTTITFLCSCHNYDDSSLLVQTLIHSRSNLLSTSVRG